MTNRRHLDLPTLTARQAALLGHAETMDRHRYLYLVSHAIGPGAKDRAGWITLFWAVLIRTLIAIGGMAVLLAAAPASGGWGLTVVTVLIIAAWCIAAAPSISAQATRLLDLTPSNVGESSGANERI